jgi:hypothetical protein
VEVSNIVVDGSGKAGIGIYAMRCMSGSTFENIFVRNCSQWGILGLGLYGGAWRNIYALTNRNHGMQFGGAPWSSWRQNSGISHTTINSVHFDSLSAYGNGTDESKLFETTSDRVLASPRMIGEGISLCLHRGNVVTNIDSEYNFGPGIYVACTAGPNTITGGYMELNCHFPNSPSWPSAGTSMLDSGFLWKKRAVALWIETNPYWLGGDKYPRQHLLVQGLWLAGGEWQQWIRFSGEASIGRESWTILREVGIGNGVFGEKTYEMDHCFAELINGADPSPESIYP